MAADGTGASGAAVAAHLDCRGAAPTADRSVLNSRRMTEERVKFALHAQIEKQALAMTDVDGFVLALLPDYACLYFALLHSLRTFTVTRMIRQFSSAELTHPVISV
jgi:hypothetical protein